MTAIIRDKRWVNFIEKYKSLRVLWDQKHEKYKIKSARVRAYEKLYQEYKKIDTNATMDHVKKRISNMRTAYLRELRKKIASENNDVEDRYEPTLWYFNDFHFLNDHIETADGGGLEISDNGMNNQIEMADNEQVAKNMSTPRPIKPKERIEIRKKSSKGRDEAAIYAEAWACTYRKLTEEQKLYARKACDEIFILGQLGKLSFYSVRTEETNAVNDNRFREEVSVKKTHMKRDEACIYAESWACSYRKLPEEQKLYAKKACNEIFVLGQLGILSLNSVRTEENNQISNAYREHFCVEKFAIHQ